LTRIEPDAIGFDLRTYYCAACEASEAVIAPVWNAKAIDAQPPEMPDRKCEVCLVAYFDSASGQKKRP
jgi:hypothetical protein